MEHFPGLLTDQKNLKNGPIPILEPKKKACEQPKILPEPFPKHCVNELGLPRARAGPSLSSNDTQKDREPLYYNGKVRNIMIHISCWLPDQGRLGGKPQFHSGAWKRPTKGLKHDQSCLSGPGVDGLRLLKIRIGLPEPNTISRMTMDIW